MTWAASVVADATGVLAATGSSSSGLTTAQWIFTAALTVVGLIITVFALFVARTTFWGDRWYRRSR